MKVIEQASDQLLPVSTSLHPCQESYKPGSLAFFVSDAEDINRVLIPPFESAVITQRERTRTNRKLLSIEESISVFWERADRTGGDEACWPWLRGPSSSYGQYFMAGVRYSAHRLAYVLTYGAIPDGLEIDHLCRNPRCINPRHLEAVTHRENIRRATGKTVCPNGHAREVGMVCRPCVNARQRQRRKAVCA